MIVAGLDVAFSNDYMALVVIEEGFDRKIRLVHLSTWRKFDWHQWKYDMKIKQTKFNIEKIYVDKTNNQSVVMELEYIGIPVEGISFSNTAKHDMIRNATKLMMTGELVMPDQELIILEKQKQLARELFIELSEQEYKHETVNPKLSHPTGRHDDLLWALCLALYGIKTNSPGESIVMGFDFDDYNKSDRNRNSILDNILSRIPSNVEITDASIYFPNRNRIERL